ncbi:octopamine receptor Oamb-like isoform X2 [Bolinopsis microptera]|uniref:octopamine receptor Oamb-like isoform X2 n=1 Tax=Bolinopsis microptera TaxID=2820187 RepID=UPI003078BA92
MNETGNDTGDPMLTLPVQAAFATSMTVFFLVDILGNSLVILAIITNPKLQSTSNFYLFALAVTDISIGINTMLPATITVSAQRGVLPPWMCTLTSFVDTMTLPVSLWILSASSLDRCVMIFKPYKYKAWINRKKTFIFIGVVAVSCAVVCCPIFTPQVASSWNLHSYTCGPDFFENLDYFAAYCFFTFPLPILIVIVSYAIIFSVVTSLQCRVNRQKIRATMTVLAVIICLLVCILPVWCRALYILFYIRAYDKPPQIYPTLEISLHWLLFSHSAINPIIYGLINPQFQASFKKIIFFFNSDTPSFADTRRGTYDGATTMSVKKRPSPRPPSSQCHSVDSVKDSSMKEKNSVNNTENFLHDISCSILRNNKTFLGLKFSKIGGKRQNLSSTSQTGGNNISDNPDSEPYFESTVQTTTHV